VFFDEAGDIPPSVQVKLLRVLEQHEVTPVGDTRPRRTSFRVVAATNRDLRHDCAEGRFRQDLFFRLAVFEIALPPLRQRPEEIPQLADRFLRRISIPNQTPPFLLEATIAELCRRQWPGNVRELRNAIEHGALMARGGAIAPEHLPPPTTLGQQPSADPATQVQEAVRRWAQHQLAASREHFNLHEQLLNTAEPSLFEAVLAATGQNRAQAAAMLGIHRATLRKKLLAEEPGDEKE
jgi:two-component system nitrogen regulation response regulator GlnG